MIQPPTDKLTYRYLKTSWLPIFISLRNCTLFQHDGTPCHQAGSVKRFSEFANFCGVLKEGYCLKPSSTLDLMEKICKLWMIKTMLETCFFERNCSKSTWLQAVLKAKGGPKKYWHEMISFYSLKNKITCIFDSSNCKYSKINHRINCCQKFGSAILLITQIKNSS